MPLYVNQQIDLIDSVEKIPDNRVEFSKIISIPNSACIVMQTESDFNGKKEKQIEIGGTAKFESKISPSHISGIAGEDLKRSDFCLVSCFHGVCLEGVK